MCTSSETNCKSCSLFISVRARSAPPSIKSLVKALRDVPNLSGDVAPDIAQIYVAARFQLGGILYESKQFAELDQLADDLAKRGSAPGFALSDPDRKAVRDQHLRQIGARREHVGSLGELSAPVVPAVAQ